MTQIFKDYAEFLGREDKSINGVTQSLADLHAHYSSASTIGQTERQPLNLE
ncbi:MAG: hypothetical protein ABIS74_17980 [Ferruginibacter sp.]